MQIICDAHETWNKWLPGWSSFPVPRQNLAGVDLAIGLWKQLAPDYLDFQVMKPSLESELDFWDQLYLVNKSPHSQYDILRKYFAKKSENSERLASLAISGDHFHGQHQRPWHAVAGNLHLSISVPLNVPIGSASIAWTMLPAVAVMQSLEQVGLSKVISDGTCGLKWVNDVLWGNQKLAGVISSVVVERGQIHRGYLGIGLNVNAVPEITSGLNSPAATSLHHKMPAQDAPMGRVLELILANLARLILEFGETAPDKCFDLIFEQYLKYSLIVGRNVKILSNPLQGPEVEICRGRVLAINPDLSLIIEGFSQKITEGRLFIQE